MQLKFNLQALGLAVPLVACKKCKLLDYIYAQVAGKKMQHAMQCQWYRKAMLAPVVVAAPHWHCATLAEHTYAR